MIYNNLMCTPLAQPRAQATSRAGVVTWVIVYCWIQICPFLLECISFNFQMSHFMDRVFMLQLLNSIILCKIWVYTLNLPDDLRKIFGLWNSRWRYYSEWSLRIWSFHLYGKQWLCLWDIFTTWSQTPNMHLPSPMHYGLDTGIFLM
jgi:hypothetical protein